MEKKQLKEILEKAGYKVKSIRVFSKTFHIAFETSEYKAVLYINVPLESVTPEDLKFAFPRIKTT